MTISWWVEMVHKTSFFIVISGHYSSFCCPGSDICFFGHHLSILQSIEASKKDSPSNKISIEQHTMTEKSWSWILWLHICSMHIIDCMPWDLEQVAYLIDGSFMFQQLDDDVLVATPSCSPQRGSSITVCIVNLRFVLQQGFHNLWSKVTGDIYSISEMINQKKQCLS